MKVHDLTLKAKSTIYISGPTFCGKSTLTYNIVRDRENMFDEAISRVFWYSAFVPEERLPDVTYIQGVPNDISDRIVPHCLVVIDDYMQELNNSKELTSIITRATHHLPMTLIFITQNIFQQGAQSKTRRINATYLILFKNPHDTAQVDYLGRQMFPLDKTFLSKTFRHATQTKPYTYLLIDGHSSTPDYLRIRTNILKSQFPMITYVSNQMNLVDGDA